MQILKKNILVSELEIEFFFSRISKIDSFRKNSLDFFANGFLNKRQVERNRAKNIYFDLLGF